jgi:hypothetical protein
MGNKNKRIKPLKTRPVYAPGVAEALGVQSVPRVEVTVRMLETATVLWSMEMDPLAVHLLTMSQYRILEAISVTTGKGVGPMSRSLTEPAQLARVYDFLRHSAGKLSEGVDFVPSNNELLLYDLLWSFNSIFGATTPMMKALIAHVEVSFAKDDPGFRRTAQQSLPKGFTVEAALSDFHLLSRQVFFEKLAKAFFDDAVAAGDIESP